MTLDSLICKIIADILKDRALLAEITISKIERANRQTLPTNLYGYNILIEKQ